MKERCTSQIGCVTAVYPDRMVVSFVQSSACSGCHAASACTMLDSKRREVTIYQPDHLYEVGESVRVKVANSVGNKAILLSFVAPLGLLLVVAVVAIRYLGLSELAAIGLSFASIVLYYLVLSRFTSLLKHQLSLEVEKISNPQ